MEDLIMPCGDNCAACPRHTAQTEDELQKAAELWYKLGWSDEIMPLERVKCIGCAGHYLCSYGLKECLQQRGLEKCNQCSEFPCEKIDAMLQKSNDFRMKCRELCSDSEYAVLHKAFFEKEANLRK